MAELYGTLGETTLNGAIADSDTSITVTSASAFLGGATYVSGGVLRGRLDDGVNVEIVKITNISGSTFTIVRGQEGTTAAAFADLTPLTQVVTAAALDGVRADMIAAGAFASRVAAKNGNLYLATNSPVVSRDSGAAFMHFGPMFSLTDPGSGASFTWVNQGTATVTDNPGYLTLYVPPASGSNRRILAKSRGANTTLTAGFIYDLDAGHGSTFVSLGFRESAGGKCVHIIYTPASRTVQVLRDNSATSWNATTFYRVNMIQAPILWFRIILSGTTMSFQQSADKNTWRTVYTEDTSTFLGGAPDQWFWSGNTENNSDFGYIHLISLSET